MSGAVPEKRHAPAQGAKRAALWLCLTTLPASALAVTTTAFDVAGVETFEKGKFEGSAALSDGRLLRGIQVEATPLEGAPVGYTSTVGKDGDVYVGTGNAGTIYRVAGAKATVHAKLDSAVVTALSAGPDGLFVGTMPAQGVQRVDASGEPHAFAELPGVDQVWALAYDASRKLLYAGTGPKGQVFRIDARGESQLLYDAEAEHVLSLALAEDGALYAGTSDGARLYRLDGGSAQAVYDFPGDELGAIRVQDGRIAVAANSFPALPAAGKAGKTTVKPPKLKPGKGQVWVVQPNGRADKLHELDDSHITDVEWDGSGAVFVALGAKGRVLRVDQDGEHGLWAEVDEGQVLALELTSETPHFLVSDSAAVYRVTGEAETGVWTSAPLDAETQARWGELTPRFRGDVQWQTRSGNLDAADDTWSAWSRPTRGQGPVRSPAARYLQVRVQLPADAELTAIEALYLPANRPARVRHVHIEPPKKKDEDTLTDGVYEVPTVRKLTWEADNPDDDVLSYRLHYQREGSSSWQPILREDEHLHETEYEWETEHLPDGLYRVRVTAADTPSNPAVYALASETTSHLLRIDNHGPELTLRLAGGEIRGNAQDDTSRIAALTLSLDGGPFLPIAPVDDLLDQKSERFVWKLPELPSGTHVIAVRATDAAGNARIRQVDVTAP